ncbi:ribonuclease H family protein [Paenibacillus dokdonensis]|uniref:Ribonuclease H n=1 Tax=Paenibacillus dokdonensis TaxID=2567944 RepID=A0ABU6GQE6_9BACL|nr:ribonuclease H family protein [Paenibacillus dokdonensis]MEC0241935.1 ribonuclease H family protein [Paenibacillus dokdonensis]
MAKSKFYVVWEGKKPGIYTTWAECQTQVNGYTDAKYKSYESRAEAEAAFKGGWKGNWGQGGKSTSSSKGKSSSSKSAGSRSSAADQEEIIYDSISVDVGTRGNPGPVEYKGVDTQTGEILFYVGPVENGTNNLGEFIAIVHGLAYLKQQGSTKTIYTDSRTALAWIRNKKPATTLARNESTRKIWELTDRAVQWLQDNKYENKILKWNTGKWGEIKADFGRK